MANPIINRKRVVEVFKEAGVTLTADAKEMLEAHMDSFFEELAECFEEGDKVTGDNMTEAYEIMVPPYDGEEDEETDEGSGASAPEVDESDLKALKRFKMLRPDVIKHAFALNDLIIEESKILAGHLNSH